VVGGNSVADIGYGPNMDKRFRQTRWRAGYKPDEVDGFVEVVDDALRSPTPMLSATDVARSRFTPVVLMSGYHMGDVDEYLEDAERLLTVRAQG
jgi:DivIVA domain-containing protein